MLFGVILHCFVMNVEVKGVLVAMERLYDGGGQMLFCCYIE